MIWKKWILSLGSLLMLLSVNKIQGQIFLNGSFEYNSVDTCKINLPNDSYNQLMENSWAFGIKSEVDVLTNFCGFGNPQEGNYFIALNAQNIIDEISLTLEEPLKAGKRYAFTYYEKSGAPTNTQYGIQLGLSNSQDEFGTLIFNSNTVTSEWNEVFVEFAAPIDGMFITARTNIASNSWVFLDNFSMQCPKGLSLGNDSILCEIKDFQLNIADEFDAILWSDNSTGTSLTVNEPGLYWINATVNNCLLEDSIVLQEFPFNCECQLFAPNAFSPNDDGINDVFSVYTPCDVFNYELNIYNKWGAKVYSSQNIAQGWDGMFRNQKSATGVYTYQLKYKFSYQTKAQYMNGSLLLVN